MYRIANKRIGLVVLLAGGVLHSSFMLRWSVDLFTPMSLPSYAHLLLYVCVRVADAIVFIFTLGAFSY